MPKIVNKRGIPEPFVRAVINNPYNAGESDFTATSLAAPARQTQLLKQFGDVIEIEAVSRFAAVLGQATHSILERAARPDVDLIEERFFSFMRVDGEEYLVSAQIDLFEQDTGTLYDWKTTKAWAFSKKGGGGKKPEWVQQLNVAAIMIPDVKHLRIIGLLKDFDQRQAGVNGYPECEVLEAELPLWPREKTVAYIEERIRAHIAARTKLPLCTSKETWGGKRCKQYCDAKSVCTQYQEATKTGLMPEETEGDKL